MFERKVRMAPKEMSYQKARELIKNGDVLTFAGNWFMSKLIRWWTGDLVSHVGLACWMKFGKDSIDRLCILESMEPGGCRLLPLSHLLPEYWSNDVPVFWQKILIPEIRGEEVLGFALSKWGDKYASWLQFISIMWPWFRKMRSKIGLPVKIGGNRFHCSELVTRAFESAGFKSNKEPALTTPGDVQKFSCLSQPVELIWEG
jgi:hypothetical protein